MLRAHDLGRWLSALLVTYSNGCHVSEKSVEQDFESRFLKQRLDELHQTHPGEAAFIVSILETLDYQKTSMCKELLVRGMVIALGYTLAKQSAAGLPGSNEWLSQFVKDGALSAEQAAVFKVQAAAIYS